MSTQYPVLNDKPIDQWKVTELKEELKRRKLAVKGLKEELVKRLFEDISNEVEAVNEGEMPNGFSHDSNVQNIGNEVEGELITGDNSEAVGTKNEETVEDASMVDAVDRVADVSQGVKGEDGDLNVDVSLEGTVSATAENTVSVENIEKVAEDDPEVVESKNYKTVSVASMVDADDRAAVVSRGIELEDGDLTGDTLSVENIEKLAEDTPKAVQSKNEKTVEDASMVDVDDRAAVVSLGPKVEDRVLKGDASLDGPIPMAAEKAVSVVDIGKVVEENPVAVESKNENSVEDASMADTDDRAVVVSRGTKVEDVDLNSDASLDGPVPVTAEKAVEVQNIEKVVGANPEAADDKNDKTVEDAFMVDADGRVGVDGQGVNIEDGNLNTETANKSSIFEVSTTYQDLPVDGNHEDSKPLIADSTLNQEPNSNGTDNQSAATQFHTSDQDADFDDKHDDSTPLGKDATLSMNLNNQVPEVSLDLGFQVKCESVSNNYVSINEKNKLKDDLNANNFHLEIEVLKPDMESSGSIPPVVDDVHMFGDDKGPVKDQVSLEEIDAKYATVVELRKKEDNIDGDSPEKLNLDKGSSDEFMEEDVLESKHIESNKFNELGERSEVNKMHAADETLVHVMSGSFSYDNKNITAEERVKPTDSAEKRKLEDHEVKTNDISKRQRRWNPEAIKISQVKSMDISASSTPKEGLTISTSSTPKEGLLQPILKRSFSRSDSTLSSDSPKERVVPPSQKPATTSLRIDRFLRPFTLKAVQDLLAKTGTVCNFWIDQIKTHCYVTYSSVEEATATRNAVYNLQWPPNGGRLLVAEFVDPHEVKVRAEAPPQASTPISPSPSPNIPSTPSFQQQQTVNPTARPIRQQLPPPPLLPPPLPLANPPIVGERLPPPPPLPVRERLPPPPLTNPPTAREQLPPPPPVSVTQSVRERLPPPPPSDPPSIRERLPPPPPLPQKKQEPVVLTLDDLFKKTRATPRIYYLPLSEEQVAAKLAGQGKNS